MFKFEELRVYKEALLFTNLIYDKSARFPREELFGLTSQFRRAAVSIGLNIAEGSSRGRKEFRHFLDLARSSCYECAALIEIASTRSYITENERITLYDRCKIIAKMISKLKSALYDIPKETN